VIAPEHSSTRRRGPDPRDTWHLWLRTSLLPFLYASTWGYPVFRLLTVAPKPTLGEVMNLWVGPPLRFRAQHLGFFFSLAVELVVRPGHCRCMAALVWLVTA
jgi:hypothetical protein